MTFSKITSQIFLTLISLPISQNSYSWDHHQELMPWVLKGLSTQTQEKLEHTYLLPSPGEDRKIYLALAQEFQLNPNVVLEWPSHGRINKPKKNPLVRDTTNTLSLRKLALGALPQPEALKASIDEPDQGMDQDLSPEADPLNERRTMGGMTGPTSQGFRHMYFSGWKMAHPIRTFQIPLHAIGQAPERVRLLALKGREWIHHGNPLWGFRLILWAAHYLQDLAQPFHSTQIPSLWMVPWFSINNLVQETTRTISNYHWAFEGWARLLLQKDPHSVIDCSTELQGPISSPHDLALEVAKKSHSIAPEVGRGSLRLFGAQLKDPQYDLAHGRGSIYYAQLDTHSNAYQKLQKSVCQALSHAIRATQLLIEWAMD